MRTVWMVTMWMAAIIAAVAVFVLPAITSTTSPKGVVERFAKMDAEGVRLTPEGWHEADALFVKSSEPFQPTVIVIIAPSSQVTTMTGGPDTTVYVGYEEVGKVDTASLRFAKISNGFMKEFDTYTVVSTAARGWKIDGGQPKAMHLTAKAAVRYVEQKRAATSDLQVKKNADETLKRLAQFK